MDAVLQQINRIPGIIGSFVCEEDGRVLLHALPPTYDTTILQEAGSIVADSVIGVNNAIGGLGTFDLRFADGRILVKPVLNSYLLLLCEQKINLQLLNMSLDGALKKLEKNLQDRQAGVQSSAQAAKPESAAAFVEQITELRKDGRGVALVVDSMKASSKIPWDQMKENAAVSKQLAAELCKQFKIESLKKIKLIDKTTEKSKVFQVIIYEREDGLAFDNKIALTLAASEALMAKPGDEVVAEPAGGGMFG